jgi:hypothetical protein
MIGSYKSVVDLDSVDEFQDTLAALAREAVDAGDATTMARAFGNFGILPVLYGPVSDHLRVSVDAACKDADILLLSPGGDSIADVSSAPRAALRATGNTAVGDDARKSFLGKQIKALLEKEPACNLLDASCEDVLVKWCMDEELYDLNDVWGEPPSLNFQDDFCKVVGKTKGEFACIMKTLASEYGSKAAVSKVAQDRPPCATLPTPPAPPPPLSRTEQQQTLLGL